MCLAITKKISERRRETSILKKEKNMSFWKRIIVSIKDFEHYPEFAAEASHTAISYFLKLIALFTLVMTVATATKFSMAMEDTLEEVMTEIGEFTIQEGVLTTQEAKTISIEKNEFIGNIFIDTNTKTVNDTLESLKKEGTGILLTQDVVYVKNAMSEAVISYPLKDIVSQLGVETITKADVQSFLDNGKQYVLYAVIYGMLYFYMLFVYALTVALDVLMLGLLGYLTARILGIRLRFAAALKMAVYAFTLPILLNAIYAIVNIFTGFTITYFQIMYTAISYIYMITAILLMKSDRMRKQEELAKIVEEQRNISDILEPENPDKENQKEDNDKKEKKEKKQEKEGSIGEEPEGNHA